MGGDVAPFDLSATFENTVAFGHLPGFNFVVSGERLIRFPRPYVLPSCNSSCGASEEERQERSERREARQSGERSERSDAFARRSGDGRDRRRRVHP